MGLLIIGERKIPTQLRYNYSVSESCFKGIRVSTAVEVIDKYILPMLETGENLLKGKSVSSDSNIDMIKKDILDGCEYHNGRVCHYYFTKGKDYWKRKYTEKQLDWMESFFEVVRELDGKVGKEWYNLFAAVKGDLPANFPDNVSFAESIPKIRDVMNK